MSEREELPQVDHDAARGEEDHAPRDAARREGASPAGGEPPTATREVPVEEPAEVTVHELVGGAEAFVELVERFYARVEADPPLRAVYPEDLEPGKRHLALFLTQYWGGPRTYDELRGHPRLRMRHAPFEVTPDGAARWATHMIAAIESMDFPAPAEQALVDYVRRFAPSMVNTPDDV